MRAVSRNCTATAYLSAPTTSIIGCSILSAISRGLVGSCSTVACWVSSQFRHQDDLTVRQFQSIMVDIRLVLIDLPKSRHLVREPFVTEAIG